MSEISHVMLVKNVTWYSCWHSCFVFLGFSSSLETGQPDKAVFLFSKSHQASAGEYK